MGNPWARVQFICTDKNIRVKSGVLLLWLKAGKRCYLMSEIQCSPDRPCTAVQLLIQGIENQKKEREKQDKRMDKMDELLESVRNRLPLWATLALTGAGTAIGILASHLN